MEIEDVKLEDLGIGEDKPEIAPAKVKVLSTHIERVESNGKLIGHKLVLKCQHPAVKDKDIDISGVKYEVNGKIKTSGLWLKVDDNNKIPYKSSIAHMMRHLGVTKITALVDAQLETAEDDSGYLVIKAY